jgi:hypothetical protein
MSTVVVGTIQSNSTSPPTFNNTNGTEIGTLCRAFVNFNGTGTVAIRASFNVSSITDNGTGDYTVNFTTAMPDANYAVTQAYTAGSSHAYVSGVSTISTTSVRMTPYLNYTNGTALDMSMVSAAIFR